ncbi:MAG TPA: ABC transporter ATP-binding protein [Oligoflexia bacterium]|nr:ABC transporter ATP-binding protein [Oligoflexia bacterium]
MHLKSKAAEKLYSQLQGCNNEEDIQMLLAKATGNFKRGNEKLAKLSANKKK